MFGSHRLFGKGPVTYEEITRIPLIVRWPGESAAGAVSTPPVSHIDLVPTFLDYFGITVPPPGRAKACWHNSGTHRRPPMTPFLWSSTGSRWITTAMGRSLRSAAYLMAVTSLRSTCLIPTNGTKPRPHPFELDNRVGDSAYAEVRNALHRRLIEWMGCHRRSDAESPLVATALDRFPWVALGEVPRGPARLTKPIIQKLCSTIRAGSSTDPFTISVK